MKPEGLPPESWDHLEAHEPALSWRRVWIGLGMIPVLVALANLTIDHPRFWRAVHSTRAADYAPADPIAGHVAQNLRVPPDVAGGVVVLGASAVYYATPQARAAEILGEPAWSVSLPGGNPPSFLALAPRVARAKPRACLVVLTVQSTSLSSEAPGAAETRAAYTGILNPAWPWFVELNGFDWRETPSRMPLVRYRAPLRALVDVGLNARRANRRPDTPAWRRGDAQRAYPMVRDALERFRREPTPEAYVAYRDLLGQSTPEIRQIVADMRRVEIDMEGTSPNLRALRRLTEYLRRRNIRVAWMLFPENPIYGQILGMDGVPIAPAEARPLAQQTLARLAADQHVPFVDLLDLLPPDHFIDLFHVAEPGRQALIPHLRRAAQEASL